MFLWRLSSERRARDFDGGYGLFNDGRWNSRGRPVTYCSNVASLAALEKRVHMADPALLPAQVLVAYEMPENIPKRTIEVRELPQDWMLHPTHTQRLGDRWLNSRAKVLLFVPSAIVSVAKAPDRNVLINHRSADTALIKIVDMMPFTLDPRLLRP